VAGAGRLIPGRGKPVGGDRHRIGSADDETEITPAGGRHRRRASRLVEQADGRQRIGRRIGQSLVEGLEACHCGFVRIDPPAGDRVDIGAGTLLSLVEQALGRRVAWSGCLHRNRHS
jgi:hypothetical protein